MTQTAPRSLIQVSEKAAKQIKALIAEEGCTEESFLRVKVKKGGCSGFSYSLDFDTEKNRSRHCEFQPRR